MMHRLSFKSARTGRQPRANVFLRAWRQARRKRVAYARAQLCDTLKQAQRQATRLQALAKAYDVPMDAMDPLPAVAILPGQDWVEFRQAMGDLKNPVTEPSPSLIRAEA